jgi:hypothetical protein
MIDPEPLTDDELAKANSIIEADESGESHDRKKKKKRSFPLILVCNLNH